MKKIFSMKLQKVFQLWCWNHTTSPSWMAERL